MQLGSLCSQVAFFNDLIKNNKKQDLERRE